MDRFRRGGKNPHSGGSGGADVGPITGLEGNESPPSGSIVGGLINSLVSNVSSAGGGSGNGGREGGGGGGGGNGGGPTDLVHRPHIVEGGHPGHMSLPQHPNLALQWEQEAREQRIRAQISEDAHAYDSHQLFGFLKHRGASPKRSHNMVEQMVAYCSSMIMERDSALNEMRVIQRKFSEATVEVKLLRSDYKDASSRISNAKNDAEQYRVKYLGAKEKLDKADAKRNEAVGRVMQQLSNLTRKHELEKHQEQAQLRQRIAILEAELVTRDGKHELDKKQIEGEHQLKLNAQEEKHKEALKKQHAENERVIDEIIDSHDAELEVYNSKVRELASDLISQSDDFRPATDQGLSMKLLDLRNRIKNITVPNNLQMRMSAPSTAADGTAASEGGADTVNAAGIHQLPPDLDPTGFVARHGSRDIQYILRGLVWKALIEAFFSSPFGFGFLGSDANSHPGRRQLLEVHRAWSRLYEGGQHPYRSDELGMYSHDPYANKMRSALFQSFLPAVYPEKASRNKNANGSQQDLHQGLHQQLPQHPHPLQPTVPEDANSSDATGPSNPMWPGQFQAFQPGGGSAGTAGPPPPPSRRTFGSFMSSGSGSSSSNSISHSTDVGVAMLYRQHCDSVVYKIRQLLDRITNNNTRPDALEAVPTIVNLAAELGLECGVQRAQIWLLIPKPNEIVTVGAEYADCLGAGSGDGDGDGGRDVKVDLVVSPGIVRIGDGRRDMAVRKALVPCEVFPFMREGN
ncbi:interaptin [Ophiostoma piceae UAMH 11346]|uniref:Interaptin n=1 Tax=Ophiostoma piceae (strain UAMH 11346) TaxID=1262450 RepID=S3D3Q2_OPHP1|nr:interaptin [Ophiostoma piceae UAMH 11346]